MREVMSPAERAELRIQGPRGFIGDLRSNKKWIVWTWIAIFLWVAASSALFHHFEYSAQIARLNENPSTVGFPFPWTSSVYFTFINVTTVGFGDIVPLTDAGRIIAIVNSLVGLIAFGMVVAQITAGFQPPSPTTAELVEEVMRKLEVGVLTTAMYRNGRIDRFRIIIEPIEPHSPQTDDIARSRRS